MNKKCCDYCSFDIKQKRPNYISSISRNVCVISKRISENLKNNPSVLIDLPRFGYSDPGIRHSAFRPCLCTEGQFKGGVLVYTPPARIGIWGRD